ncbi:MAG: AsmA family protein, partial [Bacteroidales bacterium]|nr:AsmA family protein [Bacteroidales bacterium]
GDVDLTIFSSFPDLKLELHDFEIVGIEDFANDTLARFQSLEVKLDLMSVFGSNIKIKSVIINTPVIKAKVLADGRANWDITKDSEEMEEEEEESNFSLKLNNFEIRNATIIYDDRSMDVYTKLEDYNLQLSGDMTADLTILKTVSEAKYLTVNYEGVDMINKAKFKLNADIDADLANFKFTMKENQLFLNELEFGIDGWFAMPDEGYDMDLAFDVKQNEFRNFLSMVPALYMNDFGSLQTSGSLVFNGNMKGLYSDNTMPGFNVNLAIGNAMFKYPDLPGSANNINVDVSIANEDGQPDNTIIDVKAFHIDFASTPIDARLLLLTPVSDPQMEGWVKGQLDLGNLKNIVPIEETEMNGTINADLAFNGRLSTLENEKYEEFKATGIIEILNLLYKSTDLPQGLKIEKASMEVAPQYFTLNAFDAAMGKSDFHMEGKIENFLGYAFREETLKGLFTFSSNTLDLNEFMTESSGETTETASTESSSSDASIEVPANIDFELNSTIGKIIFEDLEITEVSGGIAIRDGNVNMNDLVMKMLDGSIKMKGAYGINENNKPSIDFGLAINNFDIQKTYNAFSIIKEYVPIAEKCSGMFSASVEQFTCELSPSLEPDLKTVNAKGGLITKNIQINNSDLFSKIGSLLKSEKFKIIKLDDVNLKFAIVDGNVSVEPFETKFGNTKAKIEGNQGIDQSLAYIMKFSIPRTEFGGAANQVLDDLFAKAKGEGINLEMKDIIDVNALVNGTILEPKISLDLKEQGKDALNTIKEEVKEKIIEEFDKKKEEAIKLAEQKAAQLLAEAKTKGEQLVAAAEKTATQIKNTGKQSADKIRSEAKAQADKLLKEAGSNPVKKEAAKKAGQVLVKGANTKASQVESEANNKANQTVNTAKTESQKLQDNAKKEGDKLIEQARNS